MFDTNDLELCVIRGDENSGIVDGVAYVPYSRKGSVDIKSPKEPFISAITKNLSADKQNLFFNSKLFDILEPEKNLRVPKKPAEQNRQVANTTSIQSDEYEKRKNIFREAGIPSNVLESLERQRAALKVSQVSYWRDADKMLKFYRLNELEGIQKGTMFEHLTLPQIEFLVRNLCSIIVQRGCDNGCIYCYADAKTPYYMKTHNLLNKIDFDEYENLINDFKKLNERFGFNIFGPSWLKEDSYNYHTLFFDSDGSKIYLEKDGKTFDYADLAKMLNNVTDCAVIFDTAGWNVNDKITQQRMENLVHKVINNRDFNFIKYYNISINPFNGIYNRAVELKQEGKIEKYQRLREIYTDRMANTIFTFSPIIDMNDYYGSSRPRLNFIIRALDNSSGLENYTESEILSLCNDIFKKVEILYEKDLNSDSPKVIKNPAQKEKYLEYFKKLIWVDTELDLTNEKLLNKLNKSKLNKRKLKDLYDDTARKLNSTTDELPTGILDVNGNFYLSNDAITYPTNIYLEYKNKGKPTAPIKSNCISKIITI